MAKIPAMTDFFACSFSSSAKQRIKPARTAAKTKVVLSSGAELGLGADAKAKEME
jgi:hypothetical protein